MGLLTKLEQIIFTLTQDNLETAIEQTMELFDIHFPYTFNLIISNLIYSAFSSHIKINISYLNYLEKIQIKEEGINQNIAKIIKVFRNYIININSQESYFLIEEMIERNLIDKKITNNIKSDYFKFYKTNVGNNKLIQHSDELQFKKYIKEGVNPNEITKIIRNDEIEKLQEISSQSNFDFNQTIEPSLYERCSFINKENVSLIDYAAFFSSVKCFKYLLMNGANVINTGKYAVAGGNLEIIHLCEQNNSSFEDVHKTAVEFHRNDIFHYVYEKKIENLEEDIQRDTHLSLNENKKQIINNLGFICITSGNYEILSFLLEKGMEIKDFIINETAKIGNLYLIKDFLQDNQIPIYISRFMFKSGNSELVKYMIQHGFDVNAKDID